MRNFFLKFLFCGFTFFSYFVDTGDTAALNANGYRVNGSSMDRTLRKRQMDLRSLAVHVKCAYTSVMTDAQAIFAKAYKNEMTRGRSTILAACLYIGNVFSCFCSIYLINQSINQSNNQMIKRTINQSTEESNDQSINQTINQSTGESDNRSINQSTEDSTSRSINKRVVNESLSQSMFLMLPVAFRMVSGLI